jgi:hypothetical protein
MIYKYFDNRVMLDILCILCSAQMHNFSPLCPVKAERS